MLDISCEFIQSVVCCCLSGALMVNVFLISFPVKRDRYFFQIILLGESLVELISPIFRKEKCCVFCSFLIIFNHF